MNALACIHQNKVSFGQSDDAGNLPINGKDSRPGKGVLSVKQWTQLDGYRSRTLHRNLYLYCQKYGPRSQPLWSVLRRHMLRNVLICVQLATLAVQEAMGLKVDREAVATLVLPQLWTMSMGPRKSWRSSKMLT